MKIFHIVCHTMEQYYPFLKGNIESFTTLEHSVNAFVKNLHTIDTSNEHILVNISYSLTKRVDVSHVDGYSLIVLPGRYYGNEFLQYSRELLEFVSKEDGIFHIHGTSNFLFDIVSKRLSNKKAIAHHRGGHFTFKAFPFSFPKYFYTFPKSLRAYKKILVENPTRKIFFEERYGIPKDRVVIIPGTLDINYYPIKKFIEHDSIECIYVGRMEKNKGIYDLLEAFSSIKNDAISLKMIGEGSCLGDIKKRFSGNKKITFMGYQKPEIVKKYLLESDVFIHPSYSDSFGLSVLEALGVGLTVISTNVDGPVSILQEKEKLYGLLYSPGDVSTLKKLLESTLYESNNVRKKRGEQGRKRVTQHFTFEAVFNTLKDIYTSL